MAKLQRIEYGVIGKIDYKNEVIFMPIVRWDPFVDLVELSDEICLRTLLDNF